MNNVGAVETENTTLSKRDEQLLLVGIAAAKRWPAVNDDTEIVRIKTKKTTVLSTVYSCGDWNVDSVELFSLIIDKQYFYVGFYPLANQLIIGNIMPDDYS